MNPLILAFEKIGSHGISLYTIMLPMTHAVLLFPFQYLNFSFFSYIIILAATFGAVLNISGDSVHPCFLPDLRGKALNISPFCMLC